MPISDHSSSISRRDLLRRAGTGLAGCALAGSPTLTALAALAARPAGAAGGIDYGPLLSVPDDATGLPLLKLPPGFRYISFGWAGDPLDAGGKTPNRHDGMGVVRQDGDIVRLVRNHEQPKPGKSFGAEAPGYDAQGAGGTVSLSFDAGRGKWLGARASLLGTADNCAGGPTPWGTWLSCEESKAGPSGKPRGFQEQHGWVFEVPAEGVAAPEPIRDAGAFEHEAAAIDPATGHLYMTQDAQDASGFYRYVPDVPGQLALGGKLYMLRAPEYRSLTGQLPDVVPLQQPIAVDWVRIDEPRRAHTRAGDGRGVFDQGAAKGASNFMRLEGCWHEAGRILFTSTSGGIAGLGQIWMYEPARETLTLVYESSDQETLTGPDNLTSHPGGGFLAVCEDAVKSTARDGGQRIHLLTLDGRIAPFCENAVELDGSSLARGFKGRYHTAEWAGVSFSKDGRWMFANAYAPGITFAITGPWL